MKSSIINIWFHLFVTKYVHIYVSVPLIKKKKLHLRIIILIFHAFTITISTIKQSIYKSYISLLNQLQLKSYFNKQKFMTKKVDTFKQYCIFILLLKFQY